MEQLQDLAEFRPLITRLPIQRIPPGRASHPRLSLFAATHAGAEPAATAEAIEQAGTASELALAVESADADLRVYELDIGTPATAIEQADAARTIAYGMTAIEPGPDLFCLAALVPQDRIGRYVASGLDRDADPLDLLARGGGRDTVALFGAILAARMASIPVVIDGPQAFAAVRLAHALSPQAVSHCAVPDSSPYIVGARRLGLRQLPFTKRAFPFSLTAAIECWRLGPHGLA